MWQTDTEMALRFMSVSAAKWVARNRSGRGWRLSCKKIDVPTLILHGDNDQIVPIGTSAMLSSKLVKNAQLKVYKGASHGMCTTEKDKVNADLLSFIKA
jgi:pimeloyl-ACP methyl ester carboxylesterase